MASMGDKHRWQVVVITGASSGLGEATARHLSAHGVRDVGFEPVDAGPLRIARYMEPFALLTGPLAYEGEGGPEIAYKFERFAG